MKHYHLSCAADLSQHLKLTYGVSLRNFQVYTQPEQLEGDYLYYAGEQFSIVYVDDMIYLLEGDEKYETDL